MTHYQDDQLLQSVLELLTPTEEETLQQHLSQCPECRQRCNRIQGQIRLLGSYDPALPPPQIPLPRARRVYLTPLLKAAAILVIGFSLGVFLSYTFHPQVVLVVEQHLVPQTGDTSLPPYITCAEVDLNRLRTY